MRPDLMLFNCCLQPLDLIQYDSWNVILPEGEFLTKVSSAPFTCVLVAATAAQLQGPLVCRLLGQAQASAACADQQKQASLGHGRW